MYPLRHEHLVIHEQIKILQIYIYKLLSNSFDIVAGFKVACTMRDYSKSQMWVNFK